MPTKPFDTRVHYTKTRTKSIILPGVTSEFSEHKHKWSNCRDCKLGYLCQSKTFFRGYLPADVLFIGTAPGKSEAALGIPFCGELAATFDEMVCQILEWCASRGTYVDYCVTDSVICPPVENKEVRKPSPQEVNACGSRLQEFICIVKPKLIVLMGDTAKRDIKFIQELHFRTDLLTQYNYSPTMTVREIKGIDWMIKQRDVGLEIRKAALLLAPIISHLLEGHDNARSKGQCSNGTTTH